LIEVVMKEKLNLIYIIEEEEEEAEP